MAYRIMRGLALPIFLALGGCASTDAINCPPLQMYPEASEQGFRDEIANGEVPPESLIRLEDYQKLRDACQKR